MSVLIAEETTGGWYRVGSAGAWTPILTLAGFWYSPRKKVARQTTLNTLQAFELVITGGIFLRDSEMFDKLIDSSPMTNASAVQLCVAYKIQGGQGRSKLKQFKNVIFGATQEAELVSWPEPVNANKGEWRSPIRLPFIIAKKAVLPMSDYVLTWDDDELPNL